MQKGKRAAEGILYVKPPVKKQSTIIHPYNGAGLHEQNGCAEKIIMKGGKRR
jgi:hypothetical protein